MAGKPRQKWGDLSRSTRERYARAGEAYGLTRRSVRERYNRGTMNPGARDQVRRVPREYREHTTGGGGIINMSEAAYRNVRAKMGDYLKFNDEHLREAINNMNPAAWIALANATEAEIAAWARAQDARQARDMGMPTEWVLYDSNGNWQNPFWYH